MPRAAAVAEPPSFWAGIRWGRFTFWLINGGIAMFVVILLWHRIEEGLIAGDRFRLAEPEDIASKSPSLVIEGVRYASPAQIRHIFADDFGRSLYLVPVSVRRDQIMAIDWVESATVSKLWPNTVRVTIQERRPVAFVRLAPNRRDGMSQFALIDRDGYILRPRTASKFTLPVVSGISENSDVPERKARIHRVLALLNETGPMANSFAEINASDSNDMVVTERVDNGVVYVKLGAENFADRMRYFLANYRDVKARRPDAQVFDMRVDGDITVSGGAGSGQ